MFSVRQTAEGCMFCVVEISTGTAECEVFQCPLSWWNETKNTVTYPVGKKFESWKGRLDKPPKSAGAKWICEPGILKAQFPDYKSAVACAKRLDIVNTNKKLPNTSTVFPVQLLIIDNNKEDNKQYNDVEEMDTVTDAVVEVPVHGNENNGNDAKDVSTKNYNCSHLSAASSEYDNGLMNSITDKSEERDRFSIEFAKIHARLDKMTEAISNMGLQITKNSKENGNLNEASKNDFYKSLRHLLPISNEKEFEKLDLLLLNSISMQRFIDEMSRFSGTSGRLTGQKVALQFLDKWFTRDFLVECSWTGICKIKNNARIDATVNENNQQKTPSKVNFSRFKKVVEAFHKVIELADSRFTVDDAENFLKMQLRNACSRSKQLQSSNTECIVSEKACERNNQNKSTRNKIRHVDIKSGESIMSVIKNPKSKNQNSTSKNAFNLLPISDERELDKLDLLLKNPINMQRFINEMSRFSGTSGRLTGQKVALKSIDKWFRREFLTECSWTGICKLKNNQRKNRKKINFSCFFKVIEAFYKVIALADSRFTLDDTENFLKRQLRNAYTNLRKIQSSKKRLHSDIDSDEPKSKSNSKITEVAENYIQEFITDPELNVKTESESEFEYILCETYVK